MKRKNSFFLASCISLILIFGICIFAYAIIKNFSLPTKQQVILPNDIVLPKGNQIAFATMDGAIWLGSPESKDSYKLIAGTGRDTLVFLYWSNSANELFVTRKVDEYYYLSVVDFVNNVVHVDLFGPTTESPGAILGTDPSLDRYICFGIGGNVSRYFLDSSTIEAIPDFLSCNPKSNNDEIPRELLPNDIDYRVKKIPQTDHLLYVSDQRYGTLIYDTDSQQLISDYKEWVVDCWVKKDFFIAHKVNTNAHQTIHGIYKVNLDGSSEIILSPKPLIENVEYHYFRLPFCSLDGQTLFFWDTLKMADGQTNILYAIHTTTLETKKLWTLNGLYAFATLNQPIWISGSKNFLLRIPITFEGSGSLTLIESDTLKVTPIAGSYIEEKNINDISLVSGVSISPDGKWINFRGTTGGEYGRDYLFQNDGTNLIKIASDRLAGTISCGSDWSPSSKFITCYCVDDIQNNPTAHLCFVDVSGKVAVEFINSVITTSSSGEWRPVR